MARLPNSDRQVDAILLVARELHEIHGQIEKHNNNAVLCRIAEMENKIMSAISDFAAKQNAFNARQAEAQQAVTEGLADLTGDIQTLNDKITELQNSPGQVTPEDQALLDGIVAQSEANAAKAEALADAIKTLAALTPPKPPVG